MKSLIYGDCVTPTIEEGLLASTHRILSVRRAENRVIMIPVEPKRSGRRMYYVGYHVFNLNEVEEALSLPNGGLRIVNVKSRSIMFLNDQELFERFPPPDSSSVSSQIAHRNERWNLIESLIRGEVVTLLFERELFADVVKSYAEKISTNPSDVKKIVRQIKQALFQYWAGGSCRNALLPYFVNCGGRGKRKTRGDKKLGCPNAPTRKGITNHEGYQLSEDDFEIIKHCWDHFLVRGTTVSYAYRRMLREFYSDEETTENGSIKKVLWPANQRPTESQFRWNGKQLTGKSAHQKLAPPNYFEHIERALTGTANDGVTAVGQQACVDSTPTDVELVSIMSRMDRIGTASRILLVDALFGYVPGFYMGLKAPSSKTVKLAFLHALSDKRVWLEDLGLGHTADDWIPLQFTHAISDNTDMRAEEVYSGLLDSSIMMSIEHIPTYRSDMNAVVETRHHIIHRMADHKLPGTTYGRRTERGEKQAAFRARLTLKEATRETARAIHIYNTIEHDDIDLPMAMQRDGVKPSRLAMTRWAMENGMLACHLMDIDEARARLLPLNKGTFTENGVKLLHPDIGGKRTFIKKLRYVCSDPRILILMEQARLSGNFDAYFRVDPSNLRHIWYMDKEAMVLIQLNLATNDPDLVFEATLDDVIQIAETDKTTRFHIRENRDRTLSDLDEEIENTTRLAEDAYKDELAQLSRKLSNKELLRNKLENRQRELEKSFMGGPIICPETCTENHLNQTKQVFDNDTKEKKSGNGTVKEMEKNIFTLALEGCEDDE